MGANSLDIEGNDPLALENGVSETSPLLRSSSSNELSSSSSTTTLRSDMERAKDDGTGNEYGVGAVLSLLMIGVFISSMDSSLVIATSGTISSHFAQLEYASWLLTSYVLAMCAAQPVMSKLSDVFGRKSVLLVCYVVFAIGNLVSGVGQLMWHVIAGRVIAGLGGAGMSVIVSILITDLVPKIEVATWRSYVNVAATLGRSLGGPLGGWLADTVGWRWSFIGQVPLISLAIILVAYKLAVPSSPSPSHVATVQLRSKLGRIDFLGTILISTIIVAFILAVDLPSRGESWSSPLVLCLLATSAILGIFFLLLEQKYALEPVFPPRLLLKQNVATSYIIMALQTAAQLALMFSVPLYFQVTSGASNTAAGTHLVPAVVGNAMGGLVTGVIIKKTGKYKALLWLAALSACSCYAILIFSWHGNTSPLASLAIFPGGFGTGIAGAATFIALMAYISHEDAAVATGGLYLAANIGMILGLSISSSIQRSELRLLLHLRGVEQSVIEDVLKDVLYTRRLKGDLGVTVIRSYVNSLSFSHGFSFICSAVAFVVSFAIRQGVLT